MNHDTIKRFFNELVFASFLLRFVPGGILLTGIYAIWPISFGNDFTQSIFILCVSWGLGLGIEYLFFRDYTQKEIPAGSPIVYKAPLFLACLGLSLIIAPVLDLIDSIIDQQFRVAEHMGSDTLNAWILRVVLISAIGTLLLVKGIRTMKKAI